MKFLCDRCKTRYAIADERVRGKILKIRCKNCSAVITVREGMDESAESTALADAPPVAPPAPAALEEEWYVSRDGAQEGPFALTEAQAWIAARGADDELFCWNEGFDDWLPVEKVSHFRGLRGAPPRTRAQTRPGIPKEPEPQPLFAATMAAIEAEAAADKAAAAPVISQLPPSKTAPVAAWKAPATTVDAPTSGTPATGLPAIPRAATPATGVPSLPRLEPAATPGLPKLEPAGPQPPPKPSLPSPFGLSPSVQKPNPLAAKPVGSGTGPIAMNLASAAATNSVTMATSNAASASAPTTGSAGNAPATGPAPVIAASAPPPSIASAPPSPAAAPPPAAATPLAAPPPTPAAWSPPPPVAAPRPAAARFDTGDADGAAAALIEDDPPAPPPIAEASFGDDDLEIGEVSRVVRLADLGRAAPSGRAQPAKPRAPTASFAAVGRGTGAVSSVPSPTPVPHDAPAALDVGASMTAAPAARRRRGLYVGLGLTAVAIAVVAIVVTSGGGNDESGNETNGGTADYGDLGYRPSDPNNKHPGSNDPIGSAAGTGTGSVRIPDRNPGSGRKPVGSQSGSQTGTGSGTGTGATPGSDHVEVGGNPALPDLSADDVFAMSSRMESGTRRCYERAMKDDPFLKVSKIKATVTVSAAGPVTTVVLSSMATTQLGTCLTAAIKRWPFKPSKEGIVSEFALVFEQK